MKVALVIGHTKDHPGACNKSYNVCEFSFNTLLVRKVVKALSQDISSEVIHRRTYKGLPSLINSYNPSLVVSFHCNAFNKEVSGSEVLFYNGSRLGKQAAFIMQEHVVSALQLPNRGIKAKGRIDRGGLLLQKTKAPCILIEPLFIDNDYDYLLALKRLDGLANNIADAIEEILDVVV